MASQSLRTYVAVVITALLFLLTSYFVQTNLDFFEKYIGDSIAGMFAYVSLVVVGIVFAPVSAIPLVPLASQLWGWVMAGILSIVGWFIGALITFELSRRYGKPLVKKVVNIESLEQVSKRVPDSYNLMGVILLRMMLPVDILSYVLGLFTAIDRRTYYLGTAIGITPFAFVWAYFGTLHYLYQIGLFLIVGIIVVMGWWVAKKREK